MSNDDNFFDSNADSDRTVIRPTPGGRQSVNPSQPLHQTAQQPSPQHVNPQGRPVGRQSGPVNFNALNTGNPLISATVPLLTLLVAVKNCLTMDDIGSFRQKIEQEIKNCDTQLTGKVDAEALLITRYCLCTAIDEAVLNTPWGANSQWSKQSLLLSFHKEANGGEKFFLILDKMLQNAAARIDVLELLHVLLAMGFEGKYRVLENGQRTLGAVRDGLYQSIRTQRGEPEAALSPRWQGVSLGNSGLTQYLPIWVLTALMGLLLLLSYIGFSYFISQSATPVFQGIVEIGRESPPPITQKVLVVTPPVDNVATQLSTFLKPEVDQNLVQIVDNYADVRIRITATGLFASGSDKIASALMPLMNRIGQALGSEQDRKVVVEGHSDSSPIHTLRFPSNWDLSLARAQSVLTTLLQNPVLSSTLYSAEGKGDAEPLVANDSRANREKNRRVEVILEKK
jgi:type VI secretion system protein ImpK